MASETFNEQNLPGHKNGDLVTKSYLAKKSHHNGQVVHLFLIDF